MRFIRYLLRHYRHLFSKSVILVTNVRQSTPWLLYFLPVAGILTVAIYKLLKVFGMGTYQVITTANGENALSAKLAPAVFFSALLSHLCGASLYGSYRLKLKFSRVLLWYPKVVIRLEREQLLTTAPTTRHARRTHNPKIAT